jgi:N-acetylmuramoyl-L-alanine amidase
MKKFILILLMTILLSTSLSTSLSADDSVYIYPEFVIQETMSNIIQIAKNGGIPSSDPLLVRAQKLLNDSRKNYRRDLEIIATVVYNEAGYGCSDRHMELVAGVIYNRLKSDRFPDTIYEIVTAPRQYHPLYAEEGSIYHELAKSSEKWEQCLEIAKRALRGDIDCPDTVFFQANFPQGTGDYEIHDTSYSRTWFCYG